MIKNLLIKNNILFIYKSNKYIYCQVLSSYKRVLFSVSSLDISYKKYIYYNFGLNINLFICKFIGKCLAYKSLFLGFNFLYYNNKLKYKYHGCIKNIIIYAKKFGLNF